MGSNVIQYYDLKNGPLAHFLIYSKLTIYKKMRLFLYKFILEIIDCCEIYSIVLTSQVIESFTFAIHIFNPKV